MAVLFGYWRFFLPFDLPIRGWRGRLVGSSCTVRILQKISMVSRWCSFVTVVFPLFLPLGWPVAPFFSVSSDRLSQALLLCSLGEVVFWPAFQMLFVQFPAAPVYMFAKCRLAGRGPFPFACCFSNGFIYPLACTFFCPLTLAATERMRLPTPSRNFFMETLWINVFFWVILF